MKKNAILFTISLAMLMESVDTTVINTAIPTMSRSLNTSPINLKMALISYLLSLAIFIPISGWIADKLGAKKVFITALGIFTISSTFCGLANNLSELVIARFIQGLGGSLTLPIGRLIILRICNRKELIVKMGMVVMLASTGTMLGPMLGGFITHYLSWHWIFWVNIPLGIFTILFSLRIMPEMTPKKVPPLDKLGFILFGGGLACLTLGLSALSETDIQLSEPVLLIVISLILLMSYIKYSINKKHPIVKIKLFQSRTFRISVMGNLLGRLGFGGIPFLVPLLLQIGLGWSPELSGLLLAPTALGIFFVKPLSVYIIRFLGYKKLLLLNTVLVASSIFCMTLISQMSSIYYIGALTFSFGFGIALQYSAMNSLAYANITTDDISSATSIMSTTQQVAQSLGVAVAAIMLRFYSLNANGTSDLTTVIFHEAFMTISLLTLSSLFLFIGLKHEDGKELT